MLTDRYNVKERKEGGEDAEDEENLRRLYDVCQFALQRHLSLHIYVCVSLVFYRLQSYDWMRAQTSIAPLKLRLANVVQ